MLKKLLCLSLTTMLLSTLLASEDVDNFLDSLNYDSASSPEAIYRSICKNEGCLTRTLDNGQQIQLYFNLQGKGKETLVFIHGFPFDSNEWACQVKEFKKNYRILTFDLRGMGRSSKVTTLSCQDFIDDIHFIITSLEIDRFTLIGHSLGANLAIRYANQFANEVCKLVLVNGSPQLISDEFVQFGITPAFAGQILALLSSTKQSDFELFANLWSSQAFTEPQPPCDLAQIKKTYETIILQNNPCILASILEHDCVESIANLLPTLSMPTLIVGGGLDALLPVSASFFMKTQIPHSKIFIIGCGGHNGFVTHSHLFNKVLKKFLKGKFENDCEFSCVCDVCPCINANLNGACVPPSTCVTT